jgi:serine/threonine protein kinase
VSEVARLLDDRYTLESVIGRGGSADVYRATDLVLGRAVAVKVLRAVTATEADRARFVDEARTLAALDHDNLVTVLDAGTDADQPYLVMTLINGRSLGERPRGAIMPLSDVAGVGAQVADALAYAHEQGVIHRDVKPSNVLMAEDGHVWLADFGISRLVGETAHHTETGKLIGTAAYLAPEQVQGGTLTPVIDVYALGLVLLELITGQLAYPGPPMEAALARLLNEPDLPVELSPPWQRLLRKMTALEPGERYTAERSAEELRALAYGLDPVDVVPIVVVQPLPPGDSQQDLGLETELMDQPSAGRARRPRRGLLGAAAAAVGALILIAIVLAAGDETSRPPGDQVPAGVPTELREPLQDLHDAVNGIP